jgi:hypothetical protein
LAASVAMVAALAMPRLVRAANNGDHGANWVERLTGAIRLDIHVLPVGPDINDRATATPPDHEIENPNPYPGSNNWHIEHGYGVDSDIGGSYVNCADKSQPGVACRTIRIRDARRGVITSSTTTIPGSIATARCTAWASTCRPPACARSATC